MPQLLLTLVFIGIGWFVLIRPQQARVQAQKALVATLQPGDRVITAGGIHGTLTEVADETVRLEVAPGVELTVARPAIARRLDPEGVDDGGPVDSHDPDTDHGGEASFPGRSGDQAEDDVNHDTDGPSTGGPA